MSTSNYAKSWNLTVNNYTEVDVTELLALECRYIVIGREIGEQGTPHLQVFVMFEERKRLSTVTKLHTGHWSPVTSTPHKAAAYCKKDGMFTEQGTPPICPGKREREDWEQVFHAIKEHRDDDIPFRIRVLHDSCIQAIQRRHPLTLPQVSEMPGIWYTGPPGSGKSMRVRQLAPTAYIKSHNKWWDGYQGEEDVIIDDVDETWEALGSHLKTWVDHYPFRAEYKGGSMMIRPKRIFVTSNFWPGTLFIKLPAITQDAITRRFEMRQLGGTTGGPT